LFSLAIALPVGGALAQEQGALHHRQTIPPGDSGRAVRFRMYGRLL
jgi:hypothetical protein